MSSPSPSVNASPEFVALLHARAAGRSAVRFDEFMDLALFAPGLGYYRRDKHRVGRDAKADFYTATSLGPLFGELVVAACGQLLAGQDPASYTFVEIGAEPNGGVLKDVAHPFGNSVALRLGDPLQIPDRSIVFSNELFDAQPCRRFVHREGQWRELGVAWTAEGQLSETLLSPGETVLPSVLPAQHAEGYHLDLPLASVDLLRQLAAPTWTGLFLAFDYGKSWAQLLGETPQGTARAYFRHRQAQSLLDQPTEQDLTCHVCWDWLAEALADQGFVEPRWESQEKFLVRQAGAALARISAAEASGLSQRKLALMQLLHPANLGQKFQVLYASRPARRE